MADNAEKEEKKHNKKKKVSKKEGELLLKPDQIIAGDKGNQYLVECMLGKGGFGEVYKVSSMKDPEKKFAMKVEKNFIDARHKNMLRLKVEIHVFDAIMRETPASRPEVDKTHFVKMHDKGKTRTFKYYVMDLIWLSLKDVIQKVCKGVTSPHTKIHIAQQTLKGLKSLHELGFLHRDVKWHNFAVGLPPNDNIIYCLDFGIARPYREADGSVKIGRAKVPFMGTHKYASLRGMGWLEQCRKDDLESWVYMMMEIYDPNNLSWMIFNFETQLKEVEKAKLEVMTNPKALIEAGKLKIPKQYKTIIEIIHNMKYADEGDFQTFEFALIAIVKKEKIDMNLPIDWVGKKLPDEPKKDVTNKTKKDKKAKKISHKSEDENKDSIDEENRALDRELVKIREKDRKRGKKGKATTEDDNWGSDEDDSEDDYSDEDEEEEEEERRRRRRKQRRKRTRTHDHSDRDDRRRRRRSPGGGRRRDRDLSREDEPHRHRKLSEAVQEAIHDGPRRRKRKAKSTYDDQEEKIVRIPDAIQSAEEIEDKKKTKKTREVKSAEVVQPDKKGDKEKKPSPSKEKGAETPEDGAYMDLGKANAMEKVQDGKDKKGKDEKKKEGKEEKKKEGKDEKKKEGNEEKKKEGKDEKKKEGEGKTPEQKASPAAKQSPSPEPAKKANEAAKKEPAESKKK